MVTPNHSSRAYSRLSVNWKLLDTTHGERAAFCGLVFYVNYEQSSYGGTEFIWQNLTCAWSRQLK
jgi:hypothetical protein